MDRRNDSRLLPQEIVDRARQQPRDVFVSGFKAVPLLLVRIEEPGGELAQGLAEMSGGSGVALAPGALAPTALAYETVVGDRNQFRLAQELNAARVPLAWSASRLQALLAKGTYFAAALGKRPEAGKAFTNRISVGRARNNDVVLRHSTISKFHAWFELDEHGTFHLGDARSKNMTKVNGALVTAPNRVPVHPGDTILFGSVSATFSGADVFWDALMSA